MNWLRSLSLPKIGTSRPNKRDVPDHMWVNCPECGHVLFRRDLEDNHHICSQCDHHMRMPIADRFALLLDSKGKNIAMPQVKEDPLAFKDSKRYKDRLKDARSKTDEDDAILSRYGTVNGNGVVMSVMNFAFMGGSMGQAVGEGIVTACEEALKRQCPFVMVASSGGARMQEGMLSLMQMPRSIIAIKNLKQARLPVIMILADPTTGGVSASFAMLGDIAIAEKGAIIGFAGARVIQETIRTPIPEGFQKAESLKDHGMVDMVVSRHDLKEQLGRVLSLLTQKHIAS